MAVAFVFPGQGSQTVGMGKALAKGRVVARAREILLGDQVVHRAALQRLTKTLADRVFSLGYCPRPNLTDPLIAVSFGPISTRGAR